jgi:hypothetical protein
VFSSRDTPEDDAADFAAVDAAAVDADDPSPAPPRFAFEVNALMSSQ